jgi:hypothetical protein
MSNSTGEEVLAHYLDSLTTSDFYLGYGGKQSVDQSIYFTSKGQLHKQKVVDLSGQCLGQMM